MIEINSIYKLSTSVKGWPVKEAETLEEAAGVILGSPYWDIPEDTYKVIDKNETYSLLAVYKEGRISTQNRYLVTNMKLTDNIEPV